MLVAADGDIIPPQILLSNNTVTIIPSQAECLSGIITLSLGSCIDMPAPCEIIDPIDTCSFYQDYANNYAAPLTVICTLNHLSVNITTYWLHLEFMTIISSIPPRLIYLPSPTAATAAVGRVGRGWAQANAPLLAGVAVCSALVTVVVLQLSRWQRNRINKVLPV